MLVNAETFSIKRTSRIYLGLIIIMSISLYTLMTYHVVQINKDLDDYTSGIAMVERNKNLLPVHLETYEVKMVKPLHWAYIYYSISKDSVTYKNPIFVLPGRTPITYKKQIGLTSSPEIHPLMPKRPEDADMDLIKEVYDYVLFWGRNSEVIDLFERNGFNLIHEKGKLRLFSNGRL
jgi:hypothetical protein